MSAINSLTIKGFKSIRSLEEFELKNLNVLIGSNGSGKSNFISFFQMLHELVEQRLQVWTSKQGGADRIVSFGVKETSSLDATIRFGDNGYDISLLPTVEGGFTFAREMLYFKGPYFGVTRPNLGTGHNESNLRKEMQAGVSKRIAAYCFNAISNWQEFHFHDTSDTAGIKRLGSVQDNEILRSDASNLAAFLYRLRQQELGTYEQIRGVVRLAIPFFDDFVLSPRTLPTEEEQIRLLWRQKDSDYSFWPSQLSDGSIRFICLATTLLQPHPPTTIIIDEPELGLHPYAITLLASLLRSAATRTQVIVATQSVPLVNECSINDLIIAERQQGSTILMRHAEAEFKEWLQEYSVGELWEKNILGGRPGK